MGFWDNPENWPGTGGWPARPGESVEGIVTRMELQQSRYGRAQLVIELDNDRVKRWCNGRLWRCLGDARIDIGDRLRVTRGPDEPNPGGRPLSTWTVERLAPAPPITQAAQWATQPTPAPSGPAW